MNTRIRIASVTVLAVLSAATAAIAQQTPRIGFIYPAGGRQGTTFQVEIGGQRLGAVDGACITGPGIRAKLLEREKPLTAMEASALRDKLKELRAKKMDPEVMKEIKETAKKLLTFNKSANPAIADRVTLEITMTPDAAPGVRELRLNSAAGLSNPLSFCVSQLPEIRKPEPDDESDLPARLKELKEKRENGGGATAQQAAVSISLPAVVNGQILPGGVDRYRFHARKGQKIVAAVSARELIPYLADAVPGWFQATLGIYDSDGKEVAYDDRFRFHPDPTLFYQVPKDGEYVMEIKDSIYRGREDFVYRITVGELPFLGDIFPLGGRAGESTDIQIRGWNLPVTSQKIDMSDRRTGIRMITASAGGRLTNPVPFAVDDLPEVMEKEPDGTRETAQRVTLPVIINGRVDKPGDRDIFRFEGRAGDQVVAEVMARRLNSPLDSALKLSDDKGTQIAFNDDHEDKASGLNTHHADSYLMASLPADGSYYITLTDTQHQGGPAFAYRLRISAPRPDFELRVVPSSVNVRGASSVPLTVYALRKDGFTDAIRLGLKDAPEGFKLSGAVIGEKQDQCRLTLSVPPKEQPDPINLSLQGSAKIAGAEITRQAVPAEDMMQAFLYRHLVPSQSLLAMVSARWMPKIEAKIVSEQPVKIPAGGTAKVMLTVPPVMLLAKSTFELNAPPEGVTMSTSSSGNTLTLELRGDMMKSKPGLKGNLIVNVFTERQPNPDKTKGKPQRIQTGTLPAIPFEIVLKT